MMCLKMAMKCVGLVLLLSISSHTFAKSLQDAQKEVQALDTDMKNLLSPVSDEKEKKEKKKETVPNLFEINLKSHIANVAKKIYLQEGDELLTDEQMKIEKYDN